MNNNFYEIPNDWYNEFNNNFVNNMPNMNTNNNLLNPKDGFLRGNMFSNLYNQYKNYKYGNLKANNKREGLLYDILTYNFVLTELGLYLDINPNDNNMIDLYNKYLDTKKMLCDEYEKNYGPLTLDGLNIGNNKWNWLESPWPWEGNK